MQQPGNQSPRTPEFKRSNRVLVPSNVSRTPPNDEEQFVPRRRSFGIIIKPYDPLRSPSRARKARSRERLNSSSRNNSRNRSRSSSVCSTLSRRKSRSMGDMNSDGEFLALDEQMTPQDHSQNKKGMRRRRSYSSSGSSSSPERISKSDLQQFPLTRKRSNEISVSNHSISSQSSNKKNRDNKNEVTFDVTKPSNDTNHRSRADQYEFVQRRNRTESELSQATAQKHSNDDNFDSFIIQQNTHNLPNTPKLNANLLQREPHSIENQYTSSHITQGMNLDSDAHSQNRYNLNRFNSNDSSDEGTDLDIQPFSRMSDADLNAKRLYQNENINNSAYRNMDELRPMLPSKVAPTVPTKNPPCLPPKNIKNPQDPHHISNVSPIKSDFMHSPKPNPILPPKSYSARIQQAENLHRNFIPTNNHQLKYEQNKNICPGTFSATHAPSNSNKEPPVLPHRTQHFQQMSDQPMSSIHFGQQSHRNINNGAHCEVSNRNLQEMQNQSVNNNDNSDRRPGIPIRNNQFCDNRLNSPIQGSSNGRNAALISSHRQFKSTANFRDAGFVNNQFNEIINADRMKRAKSTEVLTLQGHIKSDPEFENLDSAVLMKKVKSQLVLDDISLPSSDDEDASRKANKPKLSQETNRGKLEMWSGIFHLLTICSSLLTTGTLIVVCQHWDRFAHLCPLFAKSNLQHDRHWGNPSMIPCYMSAYLPLVVITISLALLFIHGGLLFFWRSERKSSSFYLKRTFNITLMFFNMIGFGIALAVACILTDGIRQTCLSFRMISDISFRPPNCQNGFTAVDLNYDIEGTFYLIIFGTIGSWLAVIFTLVCFVMYLIRAQICRCSVS